jgi:hypothetical protein
MRDLMFDCWAYLIYEHKDACVHLSRSFRLPFVPSIGVELSFDDEDIWTFEIEHLTWNVENSQLWIDLEPRRLSDEPCSCGPNEDCCRYTPVQWEELGWTVGQVDKYSEWANPNSAVNPRTREA